jgi:hypothetical protein
MSTEQVSLLRKIVVWLLIGAVAITLLFSLLGCGKSTTPSQTTIPSSSAPPITTATLAPTSLSTLLTTSAWSADGIINTNEYSSSNTYDNGNFEIDWKSDTKYIYIGIKAKTAGWIAVGLNASERMKDVDMIFGWITNGKPEVSDQFSTGDYGPHSEDIIIGGTTDIIEFNGQENNNYTIIEFKRALITGDKYDAMLTSGLIPIIWSYNSTDNINVQHINRGYGQLQIQ